MKVALENATHRKMIVVLAALQAILFVAMARWRLVDGDEGYYLLASKLVLRGAHPYSDFLFTQMPLLPYVYGGWMAICGVSWVSARMLSAILAVATGCLLYGCAFRRSRSKVAGAFAVGLYCCSSFDFAWFTVVKTYVLSTLLLLGAYFVVERTRRTRNELWDAFAGILLGFSVDVRLTIVALVPVFLLEVWRKLDGEPAPKKAAAVLSFAVGLSVALAPNAVFAVSNFAAYRFGNLGYHAIRTGAGLIAGPSEKLETALSLVGMWGAIGLVSYQFGLLLLPNVLYWVSAVRGRSRIGLHGVIGVVLFVVSLLPTPTSFQYFCVIIPFMILTAVEWVGREAGSLTGPAKILFRRTLGVLSVAYLVAVPIDVVRYTIGGVDVPGVKTRANVQNWTIGTIRRISCEIDRRNPIGAPVVSWWPGYLVETRSEPLSGLENHFGLPIAKRLSRAEREDYHVVSVEDVTAVLRARSLLVVLGNLTPDGVDAHLLSEYGYRSVASGASLFQRVP